MTKNYKSLQLPTLPKIKMKIKINHVNEFHEERGERERERREGEEKGKGEEGMRQEEGREMK